MGQTSTFAVTSDTRSLLGWGTGLINFAGETDTKHKEPTLLPFQKRVDFVSVGTKHAALIDSAGLVYTWGHGGDWLRGGGQLGHGDKASHHEPKLVEFLKDYGAKIVSVGCGSNHTVFLTDDGEVLACGQGEYGRTGTGSTDDAYTPVPLDSLAAEDIEQIAVGADHNLALTASGQIYSWGRNQQGQLGHADSYIDIYSMEDFPRKIESDSLHGEDGISVTGKDGEVVHFSQIAAGNGRSAAVTRDGHLFVWGHRFSHRPKLIEKKQFDNLSVAKVVIGGDSSRSVVAAITEDGGLWTFGDSGSKMLGRAGLKGKHVVPERVPAFQGRKVLDVFAGFGQHIFAKVLVENE